VLFRNISDISGIEVMIFKVESGKMKHEINWVFNKHVFDV